MKSLRRTKLRLFLAISRKLTSFCNYPFPCAFSGNKVNNHTVETESGLFELPS